MTVQSIHHVTATVTDARTDLDFYTRILGLRLVKKTVNFDNHFVYHFYYGDELGTPSTIMTTFPYGDWNVPVGVKGAGQVTVTSFSVPGDSLPAWRERFREARAPVTDAPPRYGSQSIIVEDPSGLTLELVGEVQDERAAWLAPGIGPDLAIRGLDLVSLSIRQPGPTLDLLTGLLGFEVVAESQWRTRLAVRGDGPGRRLEILETPGATAARNGLGTVHHVALAVGSADEQLALREALLSRGIEPTEVRDRCYFQSIYFREPGGVLFEIATAGPGFTIDERAGELGSSLKLPPWEEAHRSEIEARLPSLGPPA